MIRFQLFLCDNHKNPNQEAKMKPDQFVLERYFARYEFSAPYLLCSSDCDALSLQELLALLRTMVDGQSWALRRAAAAALIDLANLSSGALKKRPDAASQFELLAASLRESSRRWDDKEALIPKLKACFPPPPTPHAAPPPTESADM